MAADLEKDIEVGRSIKEMIETEGWQLFRAKIEREIKDEYEAIRSFRIEGKALQEIGAEYIKHRERLNAFEAIFDFIQEFLKAKENAEDKLRT